MQIEAVRTSGYIEEIVIADDAGLAKFAMLLAAPCQHSSLRANSALLQAKYECLEAHKSSQEAKFLDPRFILSCTIMTFNVLAEIEEEYNKLEAAEDEAQQGSPANKHHMH